jgi:hypothetical protein
MLFYRRRQIFPLVDSVSWHDALLSDLNLDFLTVNDILKLLKGFNNPVTLAFSYYLNFMQALIIPDFTHVAHTYFSLNSRYKRSQNLSSTESYSVYSLHFSTSVTWLFRSRTNLANKSALSVWTGKIRLALISLSAFFSCNGIMCPDTCTWYCGKP